MTEFGITETMLLDGMKAVLSGRGPQWPETLTEEQWTKLMDLSGQHKLLPLMVEGSYRDPAVQKLPSLRTWKQQVIRQVLMQQQKTYDFLQLYAQMREAGFHLKVVKGILCRDLYQYPDHRLSGDEDLLIPPEEFLKACEKLQALGLMPCGEIKAGTYELSWTKPGSPLYLELHTSLFDPQSPAFRSFDGFFDAGEEVPYVLKTGETVVSFSPHNHMLYLILHAYKHFVHSGFGLRQVCDICLWAMAYGDQIDWKQLEAQCREARALLFTEAVFSIGRNYLGLEIPKHWDIQPVACEPMLQDLLKSGIYGSSSRSRLHSATVTLNAVEAQRTQQKSSPLKSLFPPRSKMQGQFPELKKHPYLLPLCWAKRILHYGKELSEGGQTAGESLGIARERKELLRKYGIL